MAKANPWSRCCEGNSLSNEGFNLMIAYQLDTLQLTQEIQKEKKAQWLSILLGDSKKIS